MLGLIFTLIVSISVASCNVFSAIPKQPHSDDDLRSLLSRQATVVRDESVQRWSDYGAPRPGIVVNVATEEDVVSTIQYCIANNIKFLVQNGGNGWSTTFNCGSKDLLINIQGLNKIQFCENKTSVTIGGGVLVRDLVNAAYENGTQVSTGNCNCIGVLGAALGGGYGRLMGSYGFGVDNIKSLRLVTPQAKVINVDPSNEDLWFALRGAGPNFGVVTSATLKAYPVFRSENGAWMGPLVFGEDKLEALVRAINNLQFRPKMSVFLYFAAKPPAFKPSIIASPFFLGGDRDIGKEVFASLFKLDPIVESTAWVPYNEINGASEAFCTKGGRKPTYGAGIGTLDPKTWREVWEEYQEFMKTPGVGNSIILTEVYPLKDASLMGDDSAAYAFQSSVMYNAAVSLSYDDPSLDGKAQAFGSRVREMWRSSSALPRNQTYINYAYGDEDPATIYGESLGRLQKLKARYDPEGRFNQWFPIP